MKLQRYNPVSHNPLQWDPEMDECADGEYYRAADVDALLARIRAAVEAERASMRQTNGCVLPGAALDKLLADGGETVHQCPPTHSGGIMPCCGRTPFEVTGDRMADDPKLVTCKGRTS